MTTVTIQRNLTYNKERKADARSDPYELWINGDYIGVFNGKTARKFIERYPHGEAKVNHAENGDVIKTWRFENP